MPATLFTHQPFKIAYTTFTILSLPTRILAILLYYIPKVTRQNPHWTYHQAVGKAIFSIWWKYVTVVEYRTAKSLDPGSEKDQFIAIEPPSGESPVRGLLTSNPAIRPVTIGGVWYTAPPAADAIPKLVAIHFHGGAYVVGGARKMEGGYGPEILSRALGCPVLQPQYRLAVEENSSFPAAIIDGLTAYSYVLNILKVRPENVIFSGDSAGGNLAITLVRYLQDEGRGALPLPRAALLWSPWVDLDIDVPKVNSHRNLKTDYVFGEFGDWGARRYTPKGWSRKHPYLSPMGNEFHSEVPIFVHTGTSEGLYDDHVYFADAMRKKGSKVEFLATENAPHDIFGAGLVLGFAKEAEDIARKAARFVKDVDRG
ncbi:Alpha/Beta hydrolase protein [Bisporella sp. PMI_857]|nr:Alpha/Beta hydrolase protein [Bisporella sp. PMI_857]